MRQRLLSLFVFALIATGCALFLPFADNPFILDDNVKITTNPDLRLPTPPFERFFSSYTNHNNGLRSDPSRPLIYFIYWICWQIDAGATWPFHTVNAVIHIGTSLLLLFLAISLGAPLFAAGMAALLFLTSPILSGTVFYAFGLSDLLSTFLIFLILKLTRSSKLSVTKVILVLGSLILALLSKQNSVVALPLLLVTDAFEQKPIASRWRLYTGFAGLIGLSLAARYHALGGIGDLEGTNQTVNTLDYLRSEGVLIFKYLNMILIPQGFSVDHFFHPKDFTLIGSIVSWGSLIGLSACSTWQLFLKRRQKEKDLLLSTMAFVQLWFVVSILPTSSIFPTVDLFVERRAYLPAGGIFLGLPLLLMYGVQKYPFVWLNTFLHWTLKIAVIGQVVLSVQRGFTYANPDRLWQESINIYPQNSRAIVNLALVYSAQRDFDRAQPLLERLIEQQPEVGSHYSKLAYLYQQETWTKYNPKTALELYQKSLALSADNVFAWINLGVLQYSLQDFASAEKSLTQAILLYPEMAYSHWLRGLSLNKLKKFDEANEEIKKALALDPSLKERQGP